MKTTTNLLNDRNNTNPGVIETCRTWLENLKARLIQNLEKEYADVDAHLVIQAVNEAHALAAETVAPQLFLPSLAQEKVQSLRNWTLRQREILEHTHYALAA